MKWVYLTPTANYFWLTVRRIVRQPHLLLLAGNIVLLSHSLVSVIPSHMTFFFTISWSILGGVMARCADFSQLTSDKYPKSIFLTVFALVGTIFLLTILPTTNTLLAATLVTAALFYAGLIRSRDRTVDEFNLVETGIFGSFSPEILIFYLKGLLVPTLCSVVVTTYAL